MNIFKPSVLLIIYGLVSNAFCADLPKDLVKKILKANAEFSQYEIEFQRSFKYPLEKDTLIERYQSTVINQSNGTYVGWHVISYKRSGAPRSLVASNGRELCRVNYKDKLRFCQGADNASKFSDNLNSYLYQPLLYKKEDLQKFKLESESAGHFELYRMDTTWDAKKRVTHIAKTVLKISSSSYVPLNETTVTTGGTKVQYSAYELVNYKLLAKPDPSVYQNRADSFLSKVKSYADGDSLKASKKDLYRKLKIGDSAVYFTAVTYNDMPFDLSVYKDSLVLLDFFYTTCKPCLAAIPELNAVYAKFRDSGVTVVGVNAFNTDWSNLNNFVSDYKVLYPIVKTGKQVLYDYGVTGFPRLIAVRNGIVVKVYFGYAKGMEEDIRKLIIELNK